MNHGREVTIKINLDEADAEALEIAAGVMNKTPDEVLDDLLAEQVQHQLRYFLAEVRRGLVK